jgi:RimJ/RimL family protein N-acetyltransferase
VGPGGTGLSATPGVPAGTLAAPCAPNADFEPLVSERLLLRRSLPEDAEAIAAYRSDPDVYRHQGGSESTRRESGPSSRRWLDVRPESPGAGCSSRSESARSDGWSATRGSPRPMANQA